MHNSRLSRRTVLSGLGASLTWAGLGGRAASAAVPSTSAPWDRLELVDDQDRVFTVGETSHPLTLIQLWASWCPVCLDELIQWNAAAPVLRDRGIDVILVSSPHDWAGDSLVASRRAGGLRRARPSGRNGPGRLQATLFNSDGWYYVPRSLVYDRDRRTIVWSHLGRLDWQREPWRAQVQSVSAS